MHPSLIYGDGEVHDDPALFLTRKTLRGGEVCLGPEAWLWGSARSAKNFWDCLVGLLHLGLDPGTVPDWVGVGDPPSDGGVEDKGNN